MLPSPGPQAFSARRPTATCDRRHHHVTASPRLSRPGPGHTHLNDCKVALQRGVVDVGHGERLLHARLLQGECVHQALGRARQVLVHQPTRQACGAGGMCMGWEWLGERGGGGRHRACGQGLGFRICRAGPSSLLSAGLALQGLWGGSPPPAGHDGAVARVTRRPGFEGCWHRAHALCRHHRHHCLGWRAGERGLRLGSLLWLGAERVAHSRIRHRRAVPCCLRYVSLSCATAPHAHAAPLSGKRMSSMKGSCTMCRPGGSSWPP